MHRFCIKGERKVDVVLQAFQLGYIVHEEVLELTLDDMVELLGIMYSLIGLQCWKGTCCVERV